MERLAVCFDEVFPKNNFLQVRVFPKKTEKLWRTRKEIK